MAQRIKAGGPTSNMSKQDAAKDKIQTVESPNLTISQKAADFLNLEPTANESVDKDAFKGFKKAQADGSTTAEAAPDLAA